MNLHIPTSLYTSDSIASITLILVLLIARLIAGRALRGRDNLSQQVARRWTANVRNVLILIAVVGLVMIWAPQLRTFALSLTAVAIAIVVATKELILCLSGAALRTLTRAFSVGDIVEIGSSKGEVLDLNLLAARLHEFDEHDGSIVPTGRTIIIPYSLLFSSPAKVLPHTIGAAPHSFELTFEPDVDIFALREEIERVAAGALGAEKTQIAKGENLRDSDDLQLQFRTSEIGKYRITVTAKTDSLGPQKVENALTCAIGSLIHSQRTPRTPRP